MGRTRYIKPGFCKNEDLASLGPWARLLFAGLWTIADKEGRLEDRPVRIKAECLPYDDVDVDDLLSRLSNGCDPFIQRYQVDGKRYIQVVKWRENQSPHHTEKDSVIPEIPEGYEQPLTNGSLTSSTLKGTKVLRSKGTKGGAGGKLEPLASDLELAELMVSRVAAIAPSSMGMKPPQRPITAHKWADTIRLMREQDGRAPPDIKAVFEWANRNNFWRANILSAGKLREKFDQLKLSMEGDRGGTRRDNSAVGKGGGERSL